MTGTQLTQSVQGVACALYNDTWDYLNQKVKSAFMVLPRKAATTPIKSCLAV